MENPRKEDSSEDRFDKGKTLAEYGNHSKKMDSDNSDNGSFQQEKAFASDSTTGSGFSEGERRLQDGTNSDLGEDIAGDSAEQLVDSYNINDKAHSDSSIDDFVKTTSNYHHAENPEDSPENDGIH